MQGLSERVTFWQKFEEEKSKPHELQVAGTACTNVLRQQLAQQVAKEQGS